MDHAGAPPRVGMGLDRRPVSVTFRSRLAVDRERARARTTSIVRADVRSIASAIEGPTPAWLPGRPLPPLQSPHLPIRKSCGACPALAVGRRWRRGAA